MLDAFKKHGSRPSNEQADELDTLIVSSKEERAALSTMLTQLHLQAAKLTGAGQVLQHVDERVAKAAGWLDRIAERMQTLEGRAATMERDRESVETIRQELVKARGEMRATRDMATTFARELEHLPAIATTLSQDLSRLDSQVRAAQQEIVGAEKRVEDLETMVAALREEVSRLSRQIDVRQSRSAASASVTATLAAPTATPVLPARDRAGAAGENAVARVSQLIGEAREAIRHLALDPETADRLDGHVGRLQNQLETGHGGDV
jgi:chromosome segregation ATPase